MKHKERMYALIEKLEQTGQTAIEFANTNGFSVGTIRKWRKRYREEFPQGRNETLPFIEISQKETNENIPEIQPKIDIEFPCGTRIKIY